MQSPEKLDQIAAKWPGAIIIFRASGPDARNEYRPAAFIFETPGGFAWVEPSYADPVGASSPSYHERKGSFDASEGGFVMMRDEGMIAVIPYDRKESDFVGDALDWFADWLKAEGRTWQEERERVRERVRGNWGG